LLLCFYEIGLGIKNSGALITAIEACSVIFLSID
jgi:hypothetical protein